MLLPNLPSLLQNYMQNYWWRKTAVSNLRLESFLIYTTYALSHRICPLEFQIVLDAYNSNGQNESVPNSWLIKFRVTNINDKATFIQYGLSATA